MSSHAHLDLKTAQYGSETGRYRANGGGVPSSFGSEFGSEPPAHLDLNTAQYGSETGRYRANGGGVPSSLINIFTEFCQLLVKAILL